VRIFVEIERNGRELFSLDDDCPLLMATSVVKSHSRNKVRDILRNLPTNRRPHSPTKSLPHSVLQLPRELDGARYGGRVGWATSTD